MNRLKQKLERQLQANRERGNTPPVGRQPKEAQQPEREEKDPAEMTPEELDAAIEAQRAEVRRLKEQELHASREFTGEGRRRGLPFRASRHKIT